MRCARSRKTAAMRSSEITNITRTDDHAQRCSPARERRVTRACDGASVGAKSKNAAPTSSTDGTPSLPKTCEVRGCQRLRESRAICPVALCPLATVRPPWQRSPPDRWSLGGPCQAMGGETESRDLSWCLEHYAHWLALTAGEPRCRIADCERSGEIEGRICQRHYQRAATERPGPGSSPPRPQIEACASSISARNWGATSRPSSWASADSTTSDG